MIDTPGQKTPVDGTVLQDTGLWSGPPSRNFADPVYIIFIITVSIFLAESIVEILLKNESHLSQAFLNALLLLIVVFPALYIFILKPMRAYIARYDKTVEVLRESEEKFRNLAEKSPNMIFINRNGRVVYANKICEEITGYTIAELCSPDFNFLALIAPEHIDTVRDNLKKHMNGQEVPVFDYGLITKDGSRLDVMIATKLIRYGGEPAIMGIVTDITARKKAEEAYLERDEELKAIIESSTDGILVVDSSGQVIHTNANFVEMWRIPDELIRTKSDEKLLHHVLDQLEDQQAFISRVMKLYESSESDFDVLLFKDGRALERYSNPLILKGVVSGRVWAFRDISVRIKHEETLIESEERYRALFEQAPDSILLVDGQTGELVAFNDKACENLGYDREEFSRLKIHDFEVFESAEEVQEHIKRIIKNGHDIFETKHRRKDGEVRDVLVSCRAISFRGRDLSQSIVTDITERKRAEESVLDIAKGVSATTGEKFFFSLVEHLATILGADYAYIAEIVTDKPHTVKTVSLIADGRFIDNIEVDLRGTPCETVLDKKICSCLEGVRAKFPEAHIMAHMGVEGYVGALLSSSSGGPLGLMSVMYRRPVENIKMVESMLQIFAARAAAEIERRQAEDALRKAKEEIESWNRELEKRVEEKSDELKKSQARLIQSEKLSVMGQLAAGLAHELNSPLAGLLPLLEKYRRKAEPGSVEYNELTLMLKAGEHMVKIVRDFGSFSRDDRGALVELGLNEMIEETLNFSESQLKKRGIIISRDYAEGLPSIRADRTGLQQVVLNMIANARDAMPNGGEFIIKTGIADDGSGVAMEFADNGAGIEEKVLDKIFDPFFTTKKHGDGVGLGLSLSYGIIKKHNGEISVKSACGQGTRFTVVLPAILQ
ncbi:MAG: PAS domain S-box protein [Nitrospirota bacterium]